MYFNHRQKSILFFPLVFVIVAATSCKFKQPDRKNVSFKNVIGIHYTEVKRRLYTGRSFDNHGYEVNPEWHMWFISKDSSSIFSPDSNRYLTFPVTLDHDSLFNTGNTWLRAKVVTKDSMVFQVMEVETNVIYLLRSNVYMTFYADNYIKRKNLNLSDLQKPDRADTLFVKERSAMANKYPDSVFSAREPVVLKSKSPFVTVSKQTVERTRSNHYDTSDSYMDPQYDITIHHAYQDFYHSFKALVDVKGNITFSKNLVFAFAEDKAQTEHIIKAIIDGYLKAYIAVTPGNTLGIPHTSMITINVTGKKK